MQGDIKNFDIVCKQFTCSYHGTQKKLDRICTYQSCVRAGLICGQCQKEYHSQHYTFIVNADDFQHELFDIYNQCRYQRDQLEVFRKNYFSFFTEYANMEENIQTHLGKLMESLEPKSENSIQRLMNSLRLFTQSQKDESIPIDKSSFMNLVKKTVIKKDYLLKSRKISPYIVASLMNQICQDFQRMRVIQDKLILKLKKETEVLIQNYVERISKIKKQSSSSIEDAKAKERVGKYVRDGGKKLKLHNPDLNDDDLERYSNSKETKSINEIVMRQCEQLSDKGMSYIFANGEMENMKEIKINKCPISSKTLNAIGRARFSLKLEKLVVRECSQIQDVHLVNFFSSSFIDNLKSLNLKKCSFGDDTLAVIESAAFIRKLQELNISHNKVISDAAGQHFFKTIGPISQITKLNISYTNLAHRSLEGLIGDDGMMVQKIKKLQMIEMTYMDQKSYSNFFTNAKFFNLEILDASYCEINDLSIIALGESGSANQLKQLILSYAIQLTDEGLQVSKTKQKNKNFPFSQNKRNFFKEGK